MVSSIHHTRTQTQTPEKTGPPISDRQKNQTLNVKKPNTRKKRPRYRIYGKKDHKYKKPDPRKN